MTMETFQFAVQIGLEANPPSTPEAACALFASNGAGNHAAARELRREIIRLRETPLAYYLSHPDILIGLSEGWLNTPAKLITALTNLESADCGE
jgi:hypothetical protein